MDLAQTERSIIDLASELIRTPSQGGIDDPGGVIAVVDQWLGENHLQSKVVVNDAGAPLAVYAEIGSGRPKYCLNACLDTAPFGDPGAWSKSPTSAEMDNGWLHGRGSADSKMGASIFCHLGAAFNAQPFGMGTLALVFDADEHVGRFEGMAGYLRATERPDGVFIGYPGNYGVVVGARGFWRARLNVFGTSRHSGGRGDDPGNAIVKAAELIRRLDTVELPDEPDASFAFGPKLTVTEVRGGNAFSAVPDLCSVAVDVRLTPSFTASDAEALVRGLCRALDRDLGTRRRTTADIERTYPPYRLSSQSVLAKALQESARTVFGEDKPFVVAGPSNTGNYLAGEGIEATCGFGVTYRNLHAPNERIDTSSIRPILETYRQAIDSLFVRSASEMRSA